MHNYSISAGNPEGTYWTLNVGHTRQFSKEEFNAIAEEAIVYALKKHKEYFITSVDSDYVWEYLKGEGFVSVDDEASYYLEPHCGLGGIENKELLKMIREEDHDD